MPDKPPINRTPLNRWLAILAMVMLCPAIVYIYVWFYDSMKGEFDTNTETYESYQPVPTDLPAMAMLEGNADMKFPPSAHEIYGYVTGFRELYTDVRFSVKANELAGFLKTTLCDEPLQIIVPTTEQKELELQQASRIWFRPYQAEVLQECSAEKGPSHQRILVDITDPQIYIVYVSDSVY